MMCNLFHLFFSFILDENVFTSVSSRLSSGPGWRRHMWWIHSLMGSKQGRGKHLEMVDSPLFHLQNLNDLWSSEVLRHSGDKILQRYVFMQQNQMDDPFMDNVWGDRKATSNHLLRRKRLVSTTPQSSWPISMVFSKTLRVKFPKSTKPICKLTKMLLKPKCPIYKPPNCFGGIIWTQNARRRRSHSIEFPSNCYRRSATSSSVMKTS